ncbi:hypothetical protein [Bacillus piscicola]|nr:hypothetical protein [Bacillus piscicola]
MNRKKGQGRCMVIEDRRNDRRRDTEMVVMKVGEQTNAYWNDT